VQDPVRDEAPPLGAVLRHYGPTLVALVAITVGGGSVAWQSERIDRLEARVAEIEVSPRNPPARGPTWTCGGAIDPPLVQGAIGRQGRGVLSCLDDARARRPELQGVLNLRLRVGADGRVLQVATDGIDDDRLAQCAERDALAWTFPSPQGGDCATVEAPFGL
jgi:hypothetical protein